MIDSLTIFIFITTVITQTHTHTHTHTHTQTRAGALTHTSLVTRGTIFILLSISLHAK